MYEENGTHSSGHYGETSTKKNNEISDELFCLVVRTNKQMRNEITCARQTNRMHATRDWNYSDTVSTHTSPRPTNEYMNIIIIIIIIRYHSSTQKWYFYFNEMMNNPFLYAGWRFSGKFYIRYQFGDVAIYGGYFFIVKSKCYLLS